MSNTKETVAPGATNKNAADPNEIAKQLTQKEADKNAKRKNLLKTNISDAAFKDIDSALQKLAVLNKLPQDQRTENWGKLVDYYNTHIQDELNGIVEDAGI